MSQRSYRRKSRRNYCRRLLARLDKKKEKSLADQLSFVPQGLSGFEQSVFKLLSPDNPAHIDELLDQKPVGDFGFDRSVVVAGDARLGSGAAGKVFCERRLVED